MEQYLFIENETDKKNKIFFLCGVKFKNKDDDKRKILKKYLTKLSKLNKVLIFIIILPLYFSPPQQWKEVH